MPTMRYQAGPDRFAWDADLRKVRLRVQTLWTYFFLVMSFKFPVFESSHAT